LDKDQNGNLEVYPYGVCKNILSRLGFTHIWSNDISEVFTMKFVYNEFLNFSQNVRMGLSLSQNMRMGLKF